MQKTQMPRHALALREYRRATLDAVEQLSAQLEVSPLDSDLLQCLAVARAMSRLAQLDLWAVKVRKRRDARHVDQVFVAYNDTINADELRDAAFAYYAACRRMSSADRLCAYIDALAKQTKSELKLPDSARVFTVRCEA